MWQPVYNLYGELIGYEMLCGVLSFYYQLDYDGVYRLANL